MNFATRKDTGVIHTTTSVMGTLVTKDEARHTQDRQYTGEQPGKSHQQTVCESIHVRNNTAHDITVSMGIQIF